MPLSQLTPRSVPLIANRLKVRLGLRGPVTQAIDLVLTPKYGGRGPCGPMFGISELPREPLEPREPLDPSDPVSGTLEPNPPLPQGAAPGLEGEYPALYARMAELVREGRSDIDLAPMIHVADAMTLGRRITVEPFEF